MLFVEFIVKNPSTKHAKLYFSLLQSLMVRIERGVDVDYSVQRHQIQPLTFRSSRVGP